MFTKYPTKDSTKLFRFIWWKLFFASGSQSVRPRIGLPAPATRKTWPEHHHKNSSCRACNKTVSILLQYIHIYIYIPQISAATTTRFSSTWCSWKDRRDKGPTGDRSFQFKVRKPGFERASEKLIAAHGYTLHLVPGNIWKPHVFNSTFLAVRMQLLLTSGQHPSQSCDKQLHTLVLLPS